MLFRIDSRQIAGLLDRAIQIACTAHAGQVERGGMPYIIHPLRLMMQQQSPAAMMAAVLHDVVEDTSLTLEDLRSEGFPEVVIQAVDALTHRENEPYRNYILRVKQNDLAVQVKLSDLRDNMNILRLSGLKPKDLERLQKYHEAYELLNSPEAAER